MIEAPQCRRQSGAAAPKLRYIAAFMHLQVSHDDTCHPMSTTADLVLALKKELKSAQMTYADLARALDMAESSVKRMLAKGDMPLSRIDAICRALKLDFAELARRVAERSRCSRS